jgi:hypothetical protein
VKANSPRKGKKARLSRPPNALLLLNLLNLTLYPWYP